MAFETPDNVEQALKGAKLGYNRFVTLFNAKPKAFSKEQWNVLEQYFEMVKGTHDALRRLIDANR